VASGDKIPKTYHYLVVGAGFTGAIVAERLASQADKTVLVIDARSHIAGNAYDTRSDDQILYHRYGAHIFHTNSPKVTDYLSNFTDWKPYEHRVVAMIDERLVPIPFNLTSLKILFPPSDAEKLGKLLIESYGWGSSVPILKMRQNQHAGIRELADFVYCNVFRGYTKKQWDLEPEELSPSVTARVPVNISSDDRYFKDSFQSMPKHGYTAMFQRILAHPNIDVSLSTSYNDIRDQVRFGRLVYTGAIDEFFEFACGSLPYRSLSFDFQTYHVPRHQSVAVINYPNSKTYTRIIEMGHLTQEWGDKTMVAIETPIAHVPGLTVPYYPIPRGDNHLLHHNYMEYAKKEAANVVFAGRLGGYRYFNMDQAVGHALQVFEEIVKTQPRAPR